MSKTFKSFCKTNEADHPLYLDTENINLPALVGVEKIAMIQLFDVYSKTVVTDGERTADVNPGATINQAEKHSNQSHKFQSHQTEHQSNRSIKRSSAHIQEVRKEMLQQLEGSIENQEEAEKEEECRAKGHLTRSTV
uniref:CACTA en-spm transposon protein n=1 Tax=Caenorhabditis tropicalis TaxID=1561998 RepID=A0A1I7TVJ2_9PELO